MAAGARESLSEAGEDEGVDGIFYLRFLIFDWRHRRTLGGDEGPVLSPRSALGDPAAEKIFLRGGEFAVRFRRGHHLLLVVAENARDEFAVVGLAGDNGRKFGFAAGEGGVAAVEAQAGFAGGGVGAVAVITVFREEPTFYPGWGE